MMNCEEVELFQNYALSLFDSKVYDVHNDYDCIQFKILQERIELVFSEVRFPKPLKTLHVVFHGVELVEITSITKSVLDLKVIDNIYRGRFLNKEDSLVELNENGKGYFFIEFYDDFKLNFFPLVLPNRN